MTRTLTKVYRNASGLILSLYFMSARASANTMLRDPAITHLPQHRRPRVHFMALHMDTEVPKQDYPTATLPLWSFPLFLCFPHHSLFCYYVAVLLFYFLSCQPQQDFCSLVLCCSPPLFCFLSLFQLTHCYLFLFFSLCLSGHSISSK